MRAQVPNTCETILANRYGDCKDHSLLLHQLLKAADIPSNLMLVNTEWGVSPRFGTVDQFNHMIVRLGRTANGGKRYVDSTDKHTGNPGTHLPKWLAANRGLVLDSSGPFLESAPPTDGIISSVSVASTVETIDSGNALVKEPLTLTSIYASAMRGWIESFDAAARKQKLQSHLESYLPTVRLQTLEFHDLDDLNRPLKIDMEYYIDGFVREQSDSE